VDSCLFAHAGSREEGGVELESLGLIEAKSQGMPLGGIVPAVSMVMCLPCFFRASASSGRSGAIMGSPPVRTI